MQSREDAPKQLPPDASRRSFLGVLLGTGTAFIGAILSIPVVRYLFYPLTTKSTSADWIDSASLSEVTAAKLPFGHTLQLNVLDGWRKTESRPRIYLIKKGSTVQALSAICPHLGCTVPWDAGRNEFACPCHGAVFGPDGSYRSGPARRGMDTLETKVIAGRVMVRYQTFRADVPNKEVTG